MIRVLPLVPSGPVCCLTGSLCSTWLTPPSASLCCPVEVLQAVCPLYLLLSDTRGPCLSCFKLVIKTSVDPLFKKSLWKCLFYSNAHRPLWVEFPGEQSTFAVDHQYMIGDKYLFLLGEVLTFMILTVFDCM